MKVVAALVLLASCVHGRPEVGTDRKFETAREVRAQHLGFQPDVASLPSNEESNHDKRTAKQQQAFVHGAEIPVKLVYETNHDSETEAVVKEVSIDSLLKEQNGRSTNRVERSNGLADGEHLKDKSTYQSVKDLSNGSIKEFNADNPASEDFGINTDYLNRALGIEARNPSSESDIDYVPPFLNLYHPNKKQNSIKSTETKPNFMLNDVTNQGIRRQIQHYQTLIQPVLSFQALPSNAKYYYSSQGLRESIPVVPNTPISPLYMQPHNAENVKFVHNKILDDYFPVVLNNPFNAMWTAFTNIIEYGPEAEICKKSEVKSRKKRDVSGNDYQEFFIEDFSRSGDGGPKIMKLKVKKGGVAIAGPGGIATAGSGGTAIVGPGGTAYTTPDGTAVVGPGGRVIEIPAFSTTKIAARNEGPTIINPFKIPTGGKVVANGPVIYYKSPKPTPIERL